MTTDPQPAREPDPTDVELTGSTSVNGQDEVTDGDEGTAARSRRSLLSKPVAVAAAIGVLGLLVGGAAGYGIGRGGGPAPTSSTATLALPATLSGGYKRNTTVDAQIKSATASAQSTLGAGADMALYASGSSQILVEAARIGGGATLTAGMTYSKVGDAICASTSSTSGTEAICTRAGTALTIKVTASDQATAAKYVDEIYRAVA